MTLCGRGPGPLCRRERPLGSARASARLRRREKGGGTRTRNPATLIKMWAISGPAASGSPAWRWVRQWPTPAPSAQTGWERCLRLLLRRPIMPTKDLASSGYGCLCPCLWGYYWCFCLSTKLFWSYSNSEIDLVIIERSVFVVLHGCLLLYRLFVTMEPVLLFVCVRCW